MPGFLKKIPDKTLNFILFWLGLLSKIPFLPVPSAVWELLKEMVIYVRENNDPEAAVSALRDAFKKECQGVACAADLKRI